MRALAAFLLLATMPALAQQPPVLHMVIPAPPVVAEDEKPPEQICTQPTVRTGSRVSSPSVCKTAREWNELHARGLDIGTDGKIAPARKSNDVGACGLSCK